MDHRSSNLWAEPIMTPGTPKITGSGSHHGHSGCGMFQCPTSRCSCDSDVYLKEQKYLAGYIPGAAYDWLIPFFQSNIVLLCLSFIQCWIMMHNFFVNLYQIYIMLYYIITDSIQILILYITVLLCIITSNRLEYKYISMSILYISNIYIYIYIYIYILHIWFVVSIYIYIFHITFYKIV